MIQRKASKITDSFVNSAHEEHFNVSKAIRDDAPIVTTDSVIKSTNFEADSDGSYILRKPLVKKSSLNANNQILLYNKTDILSFSNEQISITGTDTIIFKFYDDKLTLHEYKYEGSLPASWLNIKKYYNTSEHTLLNVEIDHDKFLHTIDLSNNVTWREFKRPPSPYVFELQWLLTTSPVIPGKNHLQSEIPPISFFDNIVLIPKEVNTLKRFIKLYKDDTLNNTYVIEIIHPEFNSITTGLDTNNPNTLDINLLLDNPYSIRDLYGYGYVSCTKVLPYVITDETKLYSKTELDSYSVWELTENGSFQTRDRCTFKILTGANAESFSKKYVILKAFLTTAITTTKYYCCWEQSKDDGITWEECPEFVSKFSNSIVTKLISDLTSAEFDSMIYDESLEKANNYLVSKKLVRMNLENTDYSKDDLLMDRPDVLILTNPNLSYKYRFRIYLDTEKATPTPKEKTFTAITTSFQNSTEGFLDSSGEHIKYKTAQNNSNDLPTVSDGKLILYEANDQSINNGNPPFQHGVGNSITISSVNSNYKIKDITMTLSPKSLIPETTNYEKLGSAVGVIGGNTAVQFYDDYADDSPNDPRRNPYGMTSVYVVFLQGYNPTVICDAKNLWLSENSTKTFVAETYGNTEQITFVNLTRCLTGGSTTDLEQVSGDTDITHSRLAISSISVTYVVTSEVQFTSIYLTSTTGTFNFPYAVKTETVEDLSLDRNRLFNGEIFYNDQQAQLLVFSNNYVYVSGTNSAIIKLLNGLKLPDTITKIIPWRSYLIIFTTKTSYLASYDSSSDTYNIKILSNSIGVSKEDADTVVTILNSIYFKSGTKIYRMVPNLYAASDDVLNIHQISLGVNNILENIVNLYIESHNFAYSDSDMYMLFIPIKSINKTFCIVYDFNSKIWTYLEYPTYLTDLEKFSNTEVYLTTDSALYYFRESLSRILSLGLEEYCIENGEDFNSYNLQIFINAVPYADYLNSLPKDLITAVLESVTTSHSYEQTFGNIMTPISFEIDFGQKSSNYTLYKQFLETKLTLATLSVKDTFPITIDIYTDGISRELHWDSNTDGAIWKTSLDDVGILNTGFGVAGQDYNGIFRQLIVKYSGKGKSIRHVISGKSKSLFKFYSMDVRSRILPKKN